MSNSRVSFYLPATIVAAGFLSVSLGACGKKADEAAKSIGGPIEKNVKIAEIQHTWNANCAKNSAIFDLLGIPSRTQTVDFGSSLSITTTLFREDNCQTPAAKVIENGSYHLGDKTADDVFVLDEHVDSVSITPLNDDGMKALNAVSACGASDWQVNVAKDVTAQTSDSTVLARCWIKTPRDVFDLAQITDSQLKFGAMKDGSTKSTAALRPQAIDQSIVFTR